MKRAEREKQRATSFYARIKDYQRVLRSGGTFVNNVTVYGNDKNLAIVSMDGMTESVTYIELRNIRAVLIRRFPVAPKAAVLGFVFLVIFGIVYASTDGDLRAIAFVSVILSVLYFLFVVGIKDCSLRVITEVNDHHITNVHRYRKARKLLRFVTERMQPYLSQDYEPESPGSTESPEQDSGEDFPEAPDAGILESASAPEVARFEEEALL